jgi:TPR repeat protein
MLKAVIGCIAVVVLSGAATAGSVMEDAFEASYTLARQGDAKAQADLAFMYYIGFAVHQDDAEAVKWWSLAARQGYAIAQYDLGSMYRAGRGVTRDDAEAAAWFRRAAENGHEPAKGALNALYKRQQR